MSIKFLKYLVKERVKPISEILPKSIYWQMMPSPEVGIICQRSRIAATPSDYILSISQKLTHLLVKPSAIKDADFSSQRFKIVSIEGKTAFKLSRNNIPLVIVFECKLILNKFWL